PHQQLGAEGDLLSKFPADHPYREFFTLPAAFAANIDTTFHGQPPLALARLSGSWTRGLSALRQGEEELEEFLLERFRAHGGVCELDSKADRVLVEGGRAAAVETDSFGDRVGTNAVLT